jgi:excisionase family DNA binding protein
MSPTTPTSSEPLVTVAGIARLLGVPRSFIYEKTARGEIPCIKVGRYNRYRVSDVLRALERGGRQ